MRSWRLCWAMVLLWILSRPDFKKHCHQTRAKQAYRNCPLLEDVNSSSPWPANHVVGFALVSRGLPHIDVFTNMTPALRVQLATLEEPRDAFSVSVSHVATLTTPLLAIADDVRGRDPAITSHVATSLSKVGLHMLPSRVAHSFEVELPIPHWHYQWYLSCL